ncbi:MAG: YceD family protein [Trueperella sp.]|nr:YceD family protein [Trueperella sp.]
MAQRSQLVIPVVELPTQEGAFREVNLAVPAPVATGVELLRIPEGAPVKFSGRIQAVADGFLVQGEVSATAVGQCSRCLTDISQEMQENIAEVVFFPHRQEELIAEGDEEAEEFYVIADDQIDLAPILNDALVLQMSLNPLCQPDCLGLCPGCGERWEDLPDDHEHPQFDPRFAVLDELAARLAAQEAENEPNVESDGA